MWKFVCFCVIVIIVYIVLLVTLRTDARLEVSNIECVPITNCTEFVNLLKKRPLSPSTIEFIRSTNCGFDGEVEKVWCTIMKDEPDDIKEYTNPVTTETTKPPFPRTINLNRVPVEFTNDSKPIDEDVLRRILPMSGKCGQSESEKVVGGSSTAIDEFAWTAMLQFRNPETKYLFAACGGSLISNRYVLTAAHCITRIGPPELVILGEYNTSSLVDCVPLFTGGSECTLPPQVMKIEKVLVHQDWLVKEGRPFYNDIALIRLAEPANYTDFVQPICLPGANLTLRKNMEVIAAGWGVTEDNYPSEVKLQVSLPIVPSATCSERLKRIIKRGQVCAGGLQDKDTCLGDSGGPLMILDDDGNWKVAAVVSIGNKICGQLNVPAIYTYVPEYLKWIYSNMEA